MKFNQIGRFVVPGALLAAAGASHALGVAVDVTDTLASLTSAIATITSVGLSCLSLVVVVKLFTWVRGALK